MFPTGDAALLQGGIKSKVLTLPGDAVLLPGRSRPMTVDLLALAGLIYRLMRGRFPILPSLCR